jgi:hypothetical protein
MLRLATRLFALALPVFAVVLAGPSAAQTFTGTPSCGGSECHTKRGEIDWHNNKPGGKEHRNSLGKLRSSRDDSEKYALAVKLKNFEDPAGMCVTCHATPVSNARGIALDGVGCERCHGPAQKYRQVHADDPKNYQAAVNAGMKDLKKRPQVWISICKDCHVLTGKDEYKALLDEEHKDGAKWMIARKFEPVSAHWKNVSYTAENIRAAEGGKPVAPAATPPPPPPPPPPTVTPTPPTVTPTPPATPPTTPPAGTSPPAGTPTTVVAGRGKGPVPTMPAAGSASTPAGAATTATTSTATGTPISAADPSPVMPASPLDLAAPPPTSAAGVFAALQDRLAQFLESLLRKNPAPGQPVMPPDISRIPSGADAELLRVQVEALALAIEALNLRAKTATPGRK